MASHRQSRQGVWFVVLAQGECGMCKSAKVLHLVCGCPCSLVPSLQLLNAGHVSIQSNFDLCCPCTPDTGRLDQDIWSHLPLGPWPLQHLGSDRPSRNFQAVQQGSKPAKISAGLQAPRNCKPCFSTLISECDSRASCCMHTHLHMHALTTLHAVAAPATPQLPGNTQLQRVEVHSQDAKPRFQSREHSEGEQTAVSGCFLAVQLYM